MDEYYATCFDGLSAMATNVDPNAAYVVEALKEKGYPLYLTTMPLFPRIAVEKRLSWANVPASAFDRITTYDNSTSTKPHTAYFRENVEAIGLAHPYGGKQYQRRLSGDETGLGCLSGNRLAS